MSASRVIQAFFPERPLPNGTPHKRFLRASAPPHPAAVAQRRGPTMGPLRPPHPATVAQPKPAFGAARPKPAFGVQRKEADVHAFQPPSGFLEGTGRGEPLPTSVKLQMERYFGADFSDVRIHLGAEAASIGALAFTLGSDIYFAPEQYQPHTLYGRELLGHELTHVLQQREGRVANPFGDGVAVVQDHDLEAEADRHGKAAAEGRLGISQGYLIGGGSAQGKGIQAKGGYRLHVGAYLHEGRLPEQLAGHSFVAIEAPDGEKQAFGFSPAHYGSYDPARDLGKLRRGVEGTVHDDAGAFDKPGVRTQSYTITREQAQAALRKVEEYKKGHYAYSADQRQCTTFAMDVMRAAHVPVVEDGAAPRPRVVYEALDEG